MYRKGILLSRKGVRNSLLALFGLMIGSWIGVVAARAEIERLATEYMNPPDCRAQEAAVSLAETNLEAAELAWGYAELDLLNCQAGPGPCTTEEYLVELAEVDVDAANQVLDAAETALEQCQQGGGSQRTCPRGCDESSELIRPAGTTSRRAISDADESESE